MGIGSGIVADSDGVKEYAECLLKMKFLTDPVRRFELIETMLYEPETAFGLEAIISRGWRRRRHISALLSTP